MEKVLLGLISSLLKQHQPSRPSDSATGGLGLGFGVIVQMGPPI